MTFNEALEILDDDGMVRRLDWPDTFAGIYKHDDEKFWMYFKEWWEDIYGEEHLITSLEPPELYEITEEDKISEEWMEV